jgi:hypothetical protein
MGIIIYIVDTKKKQVNNCVSNTNIISPTSYKAQDIFAYAAYEAINEIINGTIYSNNELNSL